MGESRLSISIDDTAPDSRGSASGESICSAMAALPHLMQSLTIAQSLAIRAGIEPSVIVSAQRPNKAPMPRWYDGCSDSA